MKVEAAMNPVVLFPFQVVSAPRCVGDVLSPEVVRKCVTAAADEFGLDRFAMAFTAFGEAQEQVKLAA